MYPQHQTVPHYGPPRYDRPPYQPSAYRGGGGGGGQIPPRNYNGPPRPMRGMHHSELFMLQFYFIHSVAWIRTNSIIFATFQTFVNDIDELFIFPRDCRIKVVDCFFYALHKLQFCVNDVKWMIYVYSGIPGPAATSTGNGPSDSQRESTRRVSSIFFGCSVDFSCPTSRRAFPKKLQFHQFACPVFYILLTRSVIHRVIVDPLEAFERMLREKDERDRRLGKHRRRSRTRSRSRSYTRSRSRSFGRRSPLPPRISRSRSPPPKRRSSRSPPPLRQRSRTPKRRSRSGSFSISR